MSTVTYTQNPTSAQCAEHLDAGGVVEYQSTGDGSWSATKRYADNIRAVGLNGYRYRLVHDEPATETPTVADGPTPYVPAEGAVICLARDVPDGWEARWGDNSGWTDGSGFSDHSIVEARPKPEPLVALMVPRNVAERYAADDGDFTEGDYGHVVTAARTALEAS